MDYFGIGLILGYTPTIVFFILTLKNRWFEDNALGNLYDWWDGEKPGKERFFMPGVGFSTIIDIIDMGITTTSRINNLYYIKN